MTNLELFILAMSIPTFVSLVSYALIHSIGFDEDRENGLRPRKATLLYVWRVLRDTFGWPAIIIKSMIDFTVWLWRNE